MEINIPTNAGNNSETTEDIWSSPSKQFLGIVMLLSTILCCLLQLKYQTQKSSPFDTNRYIMDSFVVVIFVYATMFAAQIVARVEGSTSCGKMFGEMSFFCGALASILLVLLLLPPFGWFLITLWGASAFVRFLQIGIIPFARRMCAELDFYKTLWDKFLSIVWKDHNSGDKQQQQSPV